MAAELLHGKVELYRFNEANGTYTSSCVLVYNDDSVTIKGLAKKITRIEWKELYDYLISKDINKALYERHKKGLIISKEIIRRN
jgi:hypothetical protein